MNPAIWVARQQELSRQTIEMERARWGGLQMVVHMTRRGEPRFVEEALFVRGYDPTKFMVDGPTLASKER